MRNAQARGGIGRIGSWCLLAAAAAVLLAGAGPVRADRPGRVDRQMRIAAADLDQTLIDSPNFLVPGRDNTRGVYLPGVGAVITFTATLTGYGWDRGISIFGNRFFFGKGRKHIVIEGDDLTEEELKELKDSSKKGDDEAVIVSESKLREEQARKYEKGKTELIQAMADLGDLVGSVPDNETIYLIALLHDVELPGDKTVSKVSLRARAGDLKGGKSESEVRSLITVVEEP